MITADDAAHLAEQATLGALLLAPDKVAAVAGWLRKGDFNDAWHHEVYALICENHRAGVPVEATTVGHQLVERLGPERGAVIRVHDLLQAAPSQPDACVYGRFVLEAGLRREIAGQGVLLEAGALQSAMNGESVPMLATCSLVNAGLTGAQRRWATAAGALEEPAAQSSFPAPSPRRSWDLRMGADKLLRTHPERNKAREQANEIHLIGTLIAHPDAIRDVAAWLPPTHVAAPMWRTVYAAIVSLENAGEPVDLVTTTWATRKLAYHDQPCPPLAALRDAVEGGRFETPRFAAAAVGGDQLRRIAENGTRQLTAGAGNPAVTIEELLETARAVSGALSRTAFALPVRRGEESPPHLAVVRNLDNAADVAQVAR